MEKITVYRTWDGETFSTVQGAIKHTISECQDVVAKILQDNSEYLADRYACLQVTKELLQACVNDNNELTKEYEQLREVIERIGNEVKIKEPA